MNKPLEDESPALGIPSPGFVLSARREELGWSIRDVARALHLAERQVEAIERDDYADLPGKTYVMGYWRNYAQLLDIPLDASIQVHRANLEGGGGAIALADEHSRDRGIEERSRKRMAVLFGLLLVVFLGAVWYWQDPDADLSSWIGDRMGRISEGTGTASTQGIQPPDLARPLSEEPDEVDVTGGLLALPEPNFAEDQDSVEINTRGYEVLVVELPLSRPDLTYQRSEPELSEAETSKVKEEVASEAASAANAVSETDGSGQATAQESSSDNGSDSASPTTAESSTDSTTQAAPQSESSVTTTGDNHIVFRVSKESWIDVRDSSGERLIYRTVNRGEDIRLAGTPPYSVFIGSAEGVSVEYRGAEVPFQVHESGLFARFEVGE